MQLYYLDSCLSESGCKQRLKQRRHSSSPATLLRMRGPHSQCWPEHGVQQPEPTGACPPLTLYTFQLETQKLSFQPEGVLSLPDSGQYRDGERHGHVTSAPQLACVFRQSTRKTDFSPIKGVRNCAHRSSCTNHNLKVQMGIF